MLITNFKSSVIKGFAYEDGALIVNISGRLYRYEQLPIDVFYGFVAAESKGKYYNQFIKGEYEWSTNEGEQYA